MSFLDYHQMQFDDIIGANYNVHALYFLKHAD
jgi:hypothetical protein